jgi:hypothetical protein
MALRGRTQNILLFLFVPVFVLCLVRSVAAQSQASEPEAVKLSASPVGHMDFWPKRVNPDLTQTLYIHLSIPERAPVAVAQCGRQIYELGPPTWSHGERLLHAYDLEWTLPRKRASCDLIISGRNQRTYVAVHKLVVRPRGMDRRITHAHPLHALWDGDSVVQIEGNSFSPIVSVLWVSAGQYRKFERAVRTASSGDGSELVVPFAPALVDAPLGEYLLIVENEDRTAAVSPIPFTVFRGGEPEFESTALVSIGEKNYLSIEGTGLGEVERASIFLAGENSAARIIPSEGSILPGLLVELPAGPSSGFEALSGLSFEDGELRLRFDGGSRLTGKQSKTRR